MIIAMLQENALAGKRKSGERTDSEDDTDDDIEVIEPAQGWAYVGSHNFTPSAWGTLSGSAFNPTLNVSCPPAVLHFLADPCCRSRIMKSGLSFS